MIKFKKNIKFILILLYFSFIIFIIKNPIFYEISYHATTISLIFLISGLLELLFYTYRNNHLLQSFFCIYICNTIICMLYLKITDLYMLYCQNLQYSHSCCCDLEWLGKRIRNYKITVEWIQYETLFILTFILLKFIVFRIIYYKNFSDIKKDFIYFNTLVMILYLLNSGYFKAIYKSSDIFYSDKLYLNKTYYYIYCHGYITDDNIDFDKVYPNIDWNYKTIYSIPDDYYSKLLKVFIKK